MEMSQRCPPITTKTCEKGWAQPDPRLLPHHTLDLQDEFKVPYSKLFSDMKDSQYDDVWNSIDTDKSGTLSLEELAAHYGFDLNHKEAASDNMSDEQILEALQVYAQAIVVLPHSLTAA